MDTTRESVEEVPLLSLELCAGEEGMSKAFAAVGFETKHLIVIKIDPQQVNSALKKLSLEVSIKAYVTTPISTTHSQLCGQRPSARLGQGRSVAGIEIRVF